VYPAANTARTAPTTTNASGRPVFPITPNAVGTIPATTVSGAAAAATTNRMGPTPRRPPARADTFCPGFNWDTMKSTPRCEKSSMRGQRTATHDEQEQPAWGPAQRTGRDQIAVRCLGGPGPG